MNNFRKISISLIIACFLKITISLYYIFNLNTNDCNFLPKSLISNSSYSYYGIEYGLNFLHYTISDLFPLIMIISSFKQSMFKKYESSLTSDNKSDIPSYGYFDNLKFASGSFVKIKDPSTSDIYVLENEDVMGSYLKID